MKNMTEQKCDETYTAFMEKLQKNSDQRTLIFHVFSGHGALKNRNQSMLINKFDPTTQFYERFEAEKWIKRIAQECPNTYNIGVFGNHRDPEQKEYTFTSHQQAQNKIAQQIKQLELLEK